MNLAQELEQVNGESTVNNLKRWGKGNLADHPQDITPAHLGNLGPILTTFMK